MTLEFQQLVEDVMTLLTARMGKQLPARHHGVEQAAENLGHLDALPAGVFALMLPVQRLGSEVMVASDEVVGDLHQSRSQAPIGAAAQRTIGTIDAVTLVAGRHQTGATRKGVGV